MINFKCLWSEFFCYLIQKSFQNDEEWRLFYCDSTLGCRVIQDFDLCKLDELSRHSVDTKWCIITKNWLCLTTFSVKNLLHSSQSSMICPLWYFHIKTMDSTPSPFKGEKIRVFILQEVLLALVVHSVGVSEYIYNIYITQHKHKKVC